MASLILKRLTKLSIGAEVEITYLEDKDSVRKIIGVVTDNDGTACLELVDREGEEYTLGYAMIQIVKVCQSLEAILKNLPVGTKVTLTYGFGKDDEQTFKGTVSDNDGEESLELTSDEEELVLLYSQIRSLRTGEAASEKPEPEQKEEQRKPKKEGLSQKTPEDCTKLTDGEMKQLFDRLDREDKQKMRKFFDVYTNGIKMTSMDKMKGAALQAKKYILEEDRRGYYWTEDAVRLCGAMLRRVDQADPEIYLLAECFEEAAVSFWKKKEYALGGAYALLTLLEKKPEDAENLYIILAAGVVQGKDVSALKRYHSMLDPKYTKILGQILEEACGVCEVAYSDQEPVADTLARLEPMFSGKLMEEEAYGWLKAAVPSASAEPKEIRNEEKPKPESVPVPKTAYGIITRLDWIEGSGIITANNGSKYRFLLKDVSEQILRRKLENCMRGDLGGEFYSVKFNLLGDRVESIRPNTALVDQARAIFACAEREDRYEAAFQVARQAAATADIRRALGELVRIAMAHKLAANDLRIVQEALEIVEAHEESYPIHAFALMDLAQCYEYLNKKTKMLTKIEQALEVPGLSVRQKESVVSLYVRMLRDQYQASGSRDFCNRIMRAINDLQRDFSAELENDSDAMDIFRRDLLPYRIQAQCALDMMEEAEADYQTLCDFFTPRDTLVRLMEQTRQRLGCAVPVQPEAEPVEQEVEEGFEELTEEIAEEDEFDTEPVVPYTDTEGWAALHTSKREVVDYAIGISGPNRLAPMMAYLRAGASLNPDVSRVYRTVALACNDPMEASDYSIVSLMNMLSEADEDYPVLNDYCIGAAFLRASFLSGRGYDYSAQGLRDSIGIVQRYSALRSAYDLLESFRTDVGYSIDIYADYRNKDTKKLQEDMAAVIEQAGELYQKFIVTPPRDGAKFARLLETKKIVFARDGDLAVLLRCIMEQNTAELEARKADFFNHYFSDNGSTSSVHIRSTAVDELIVRCWDEAGRAMQIKRFNATLQGDRRNNLRSNINEILSVIRQWYDLAEQDASLTWRTEQGSEAYQRLRPLLLEQLENLSEICRREMEDCTDSQQNAGLFLLDTTARELAARLDGSWKMEQEKFFYVDFLTGNHILLDEEFMPELSSTFCALPEFNVLARIRKHAEGERATLQEQICRIYGEDQTLNNYGTALRILSYLKAQEGGEQTVVLPEHHEEYLEHSRMQSELSYRSFREKYALALSRGQIIKSDQFCYTLEDTVRYWYNFCLSRNNFGFFTSILQQVEEQIHESARQYEQQLAEQLDVLVERDPQIFAKQPGAEESIREQIADQNFTVAEDWMARIRRGEDIDAQSEKPEALQELDSFWDSYRIIYDRVSNNRRPLANLMERRAIRNEDQRWGRRVIDAWLSNCNPSNSERIGELLHLLGWQAIQTERYHFAASPEVELYRVTREFNAAGLTTPVHPIAEYGTLMERKPMFVVCLYGMYDCDRLYEKMRTLDQLDGSILILLDYALGQGERRKLARKMKKRESDLRNKYLVIDRVLITYLSENCNENVVNRFLIALSAPFSYFQPYVVESADTMPPEIFIGRRDELMKVEKPNGVNLIYGGRQLGKSALFKKALSDIDGRNGQRAVMVDINGLNCAEAARKVSAKLMDMNILQEQIGDPENWDDLCRSIERRLRSSENEITYLILMLDEADDFIKDCENNGYRPMVALKDVQQSLPGKFKYVLAGLHDIVKFNRQVALGNNSVITHMSSLKITPFRTTDAKELLTGPLSFLGFSLPSEVTVSQILATCNYFPGLIQLYAKKLIESVRAADYAGYEIPRTPPYVVSEEHLRRVMADKEFVAEIHNKFVATLTLDEKEDNYYYPLALLIGWMYNIAPSKNGYTARDVMFHARDLSIGPLMKLDEERVEALLQELEDLNILRLVAGNSYLLASKNFRDLLGSDEEIFEKLTQAGGAHE